jgi:ABC-type lipopolysaccharide export system ATPase subunit
MSILKTQNLGKRYGERVGIEQVDLEVEAGTVSVRRLGQQGQKVVSLDEAVAALAAEATPPDLRRG